MANRTDLRSRGAKSGGNKTKTPLFRPTNQVLCVCVFVLSLVFGVPAFAQQSGPGASQPALVLDQASESQQVRQKLESLRESYLLRLQELDDELKRLGFQSEDP
jgi:hypothetical protein